MTGIELIAKERQKQIEKHGFTGKHHANHPEWYDENQLVQAARHLSTKHCQVGTWYPFNWDKTWFYELCQKPYEERMIIAGALIAAEIDRLLALK